jgi:hypothetical protein
MNDKKPLSLLFVLGFSVAGFLFSGYLTAVKVFSGGCAFNETCPIFLGHPACWYGFALYSALLALSVLTFSNKLALRSGLLAATAIALVGIVFAGYLTVGEYATFMAGGFEGSLGLPTCFLGLIFYMFTFVSGALGIAHHRED